MVKKLPANTGAIGDADFISGLGRSPGEEMATTPVFFPGKSRGQRSLADYRP